MLTIITFIEKYLFLEWQWNIVQVCGAIFVPAQVYFAV